jgi:hypothetical protein
VVFLGILISFTMHLSFSISNGILLLIVKSKTGSCCISFGIWHLRQIWHQWLSFYQTLLQKRRFQCVPLYIFHILVVIYQPPTRRNHFCNNLYQWSRYYMHLFFAFLWIKVASMRISQWQSLLFLPQLLYLPHQHQMSDKYDFKAIPVDSLHTT